MAPPASTQQPARSRHSNPDLFADGRESITSTRARVMGRARMRQKPPREPWRDEIACDVEIRLRETYLGAEAFKVLRDQIELQVHLRLSEAVLERSARRFLVSHGPRILAAVMRQRFVGRQIVEDDLIECFDRAFTTGRASSGDEVRPRPWEQPEAALDSWPSYGDGGPPPEEEPGR